LELLQVQVLNFIKIASCRQEWPSFFTDPPPSTMDPILQNDTHTTELERQNCIQRAQQAMDICVVMPSMRNPLHNTLLNAETKIQALCQVLAKPAEIDDINDVATCCRTNANYILSLGEHIEPLRVDMVQAKDLVTGLLIMFDHFLAATKQLPPDMSSVGGKLQDCAVRWNAREDEAQFITAFTDGMVTFLPRLKHITHSLLPHRCLLSPISYHHAHRWRIKR
jgi:hypothetical protein